MTYNVVIETLTGDCLRAGYCDFLNDGSFDPATETILTDVVFPKRIRVPGDLMDKWTGTEWIEVTSPLPT